MLALPDRPAADFSDVTRSLVDGLVAQPAAPRWSPNPGPQSHAFASDTQFMLFGGEVGGGKSFLLLGLARYRHRHSLLLRRNFTELERNLIKKSLELFADDRKCYNASSHRWSFPDGVTIQFGHAENELDVEKYKSDEYDLIGIDEASDFTPFQLRYLPTRARGKPGQFVQVVMATNPGGAGGQYIRQAFMPWIDLGVAPGVELTRKMVGDEFVGCAQEDPLALRMTFFPARLEDNPFTDHVAYRKMLSMVAEPRRSQLERGDWSAGETDADYQVIPGEWVRLAFARWRAWKASQVELPKEMTVAGCDIGSLRDNSVIAPRYGSLVSELLRLRVEDTMQVCGFIVLVLRARGGTAMVDFDGIGNGVYYRLKEQDLPVLPFHGGLVAEFYDASGLMRYANMRSADEADAVVMAFWDDGGRFGAVEEEAREGLYELYGPKATPQLMGRMR